MASARSINVHLRLKPREVKAWRGAAKRADVTLSEWIRSRCSVDQPPSTVPADDVRRSAGVASEEPIGEARSTQASLLSLAAARVILRADEALAITHEARVVTGTTLDDEERDAWIALFTAASARVAAWEAQRRPA